jgi:hypothetical protein
MQCPFTKSVWEKVIIDQNLKNSWKGNTLSDCFKNWFEDKTIPTPIAAIYVGSYG